MKHIKKAAAVIAAAVLCMGMSMSAFASSVTDPAIEKPVLDKDGNTLSIQYIYGGQATDKDGNKFTMHSTVVSEEVEEILKDGDKVREILTDAGYEVKEEQDVVVLGAGDYELVGEYDFASGDFEKYEVPEGGIDVEIQIGFEYQYEYDSIYGDPYQSGRNDEYMEGIQEGDTVYILHQTADGTWEVLEGTIAIKTHTNDSGSEYYQTTSTYSYYYVTAHLDSLSPVAVIKVMSNGEVVTLTKDGEKLPIDLGELQKPNTGKEDTTTVTDKEEQNAEASDNGQTKEETIEGQKAQTEKTSAVKTTSTVKKSPKTGNF